MRQNYYLKCGSSTAIDATVKFYGICYQHWAETSERAARTTPR
jgi:hypothetical protein